MMQTQMLYLSSIMHAGDAWREGDGGHRYIVRAETQLGA